MSDKDIEEMLDSLGIPKAYHHFDDDVEPPFIIYVEESIKSFRADGMDYFSYRNITFELYSDTKDMLLISMVEDMLKEHDIHFKREEAWIEKEGMFETAFMVQL